MLYATDGISTDKDFNKAMVGVASVWCVTLQIRTQLREDPFKMSFIGMKATRKYFQSIAFVNLLIHNRAP